MSAPQGLIQFPGVKDFLSGSFTLAQGAGPSSGTIYFPPQRGWIPKQGTLALTYGGTRIALQNCIADSLDITYGADGREVWALHVLDQRAWWRSTGCVSGYYNARRGFGDTRPQGTTSGGQPQNVDIVRGTEQSPRALARLCFEAMGVERFDVSQMPNDTRPEVEWDYTLPAQALSQLCDQLGCRIAPKLDNSFAIVKTGIGATLPANQLVMDGGLAVDTPEIPDELICCTSRVRYQGDLELEAVGQELDGTIRPIDRLCYAPKLVEGLKFPPWDYPFFNNVQGLGFRQIARETVFRWYRIKTPFDIFTGAQGLAGGRINGLNRILPIEDRQIETEKILGEDRSIPVEVVETDASSHRIEPRPAWVYGIYCGAKEKVMSDELARQPDVIKHPEGFYHKGFSVDKELGIVKFAEHVFRYAVPGCEIIPAQLWLRVAFSVRDPETRGWGRWVYKRAMPEPKKGTQPRYLLRDDIAAHVVKDCNGRWSDNSGLARQQADYYLDAAMREYQLSDPSSYTYAGFVPICPDGAIQQVTWQVDGQGYATTKASRNSELSITTIPYQERRLYERIQAGLQGRDRTSRQNQRLLDQGRV